jgi:hypothetical protein
MGLTVIENEPRTIIKHLELEGDGATPIEDSTTIPAGYNFVQFTNLGTTRALAHITEAGTPTGDPTDFDVAQVGVLIPASTVNGGLRFHRFKADKTTANELRLQCAASGVDIVVEYSKVGSVLTSR